MRQNNDNRISQTLHLIKLRAQVAMSRDLTHEELAAIAGVGTRAMGDWMRGTVAPIGMGAVFALLEALPPTDRDEVLKKWRELKPARGSPKKQGINGRAKAVRSSGAQSTKKPKKAAKGNQGRNRV